MNDDLRVPGSFICAICGTERPPEAKAMTGGANYCADCWSDYQRRRNRAKTRGEKFSIQDYRTLRARLGLPIPFHKVHAGGRAKATVEPCRCCGTKIRTTYLGERICSQCMIAYRRWHAVDKRIDISIYCELQEAGREQQGRPILPNDPYLVVPRYVIAFLDEMERVSREAVQLLYTTVPPMIREQVKLEFTNAVRKVELHEAKEAQLAEEDAAQPPSASDLRETDATSYSARVHGGADRGVYHDDDKGTREARMGPSSAVDERRYERR